MLSGILSGQHFISEITGDESLQRRPMKRICAPLRLMGAQIEAREGDFAPLRISGGNLVAIDYDMPVASAQLKSCLLFAGLYANGRTSVREPAVTRDHTEIMLREFGAAVESTAGRITITGQPRLRARDYQVPGDISSAAFLLAAALMLPDSEILINAVGINPTRRAIIDLLIKFGADIELSNMRELCGEPICDLRARYSKLASNQENQLLAGDIIANLIDEIPIIAVLATKINGGLTIRDAGELRVKESDRIRAVVDNLQAMGAQVTEFPDGLAVAGPQSLRGARIDAVGDHRIAMAFAIAALAAIGESEIIGSESVDISFPGFFDTLKHLVE
jgi:3-phosphoshikimate 1-carboxyvinyltransferase